MRPTRRSSTLVGWVALAAMLFQPAVGWADAVIAKPDDAKPTRAKHRHKGATEPAGFAAASQFVRKDDVAAAIPCGPDVTEHVKSVRTFVDAGFTDIAVIQIGGQTQPAFLDWAEQELLPALRAS